MLTSSSNNDLLGPYDIMADPYGDHVLSAAQTAPVKARPDLTLRDEANAISIYVFRNTFLENLHRAGRITDAEMKKWNIQSSAKLAHWLYVRDACRKTLPKRYFAEVEGSLKYAKGWERTELDCEIPSQDYVRCPGCSTEDLPYRMWRHCPWCGTKLADAGPVSETHGPITSADV